MASPYDRLLGIPQTEEQGTTRLVPAVDPSASLLPPSMTATSVPTSVAAPVAATPPPANLLDPGRFLTVGEFFDSPGYKGALTPHKQELEKQYSRTYMTPARMKAAGATQAQQAEAMAEFARQRVKPETSKGWRGALDTDLVDQFHVGFMGAAAGVARVLGADSVADELSANVERTKKEDFSPESRMKMEEEQYAAQKLAKQHGGEDNVPWWAEVVQGLSNFGRQPVNKTLQALGSSTPALLAAVPAAAGGAGVATGYSLSVLTSALLTAGDSGGGAYDKIMAMPESALQNSIEYVEARANGETHDQARKTVADRAVREAAVLAAPLGAAAGLAGLRFGAEGLVAGGKGVIRRTAGEMAQEGVEEGAGQGIQNRAVQRADPEQSLTEGAFTAAAEGAAAGGGMTVAVGALTRGGTAPSPPAAEVDPEQAPTAPDTPPVSPSEAAATAMQMPSGDWDNPSQVAPPQATPDAVLDADTSVPGNYAAPAAPDVVLATDDVPASQALKSLFLAGGDPEAQVTTLMNNLPSWVSSDPTVGRLITDMKSTDPEADPQMAKTLANDLIGRVAFVQASEAARWQGVEQPATAFAGLGVEQVRNQFLPNFSGRLWDSNVRKAFGQQVKAAQSAGIAQRPLPPGVPPRPISSAAIQGTVVDGNQDQLMTGRATGAPPVRLPDAEIARGQEGNVEAIAGNLGTQQPVPSEASPNSVPAPAPVQDAPVPPTPEQLAERAIEQVGLLNDPAADWKKPNRAARGRTYDESSLTERVTADELNQLVQGRPVNALQSVAKRHAGQPSGAFAQDLLRSMAGLVKTRAGNEALNTVAARFSSGGGERGTITFNPNQPPSTHVLLHEFAHALTAEAIRNPITDRQKLAVQQLTRQMEWVSQNLPGNHPARRAVVMGGFNNPAEFAAEVYSNPSLQNYLKSVPSRAEHGRRRTRGKLWDSFIDAVSSLMKIRRTALMDTFMTLREIDDGLINREADTARAAQSAPDNGGAGSNQPETAGVPEAAGNSGGGDPAVQTPDERGGPNNPELPGTGESTDYGPGEAVEDERDPVTHAADPRGDGPTGTVADVAAKVMADMTDEDLSTLLAASAAIGLTPEELLADAARYGAEDIKKVDPALGKALENAVGNMDLFAQSPLLMKAQTVLDSVLSTPAHIRKHEDLIKLGMTGEQPTINTLDTWWAKAREKFVDSSTPFLKALGWDQNSQLWKKYKRGGSKLQQENMILNEQFADLNREMNAFARELNLPVAETFAYIDRYTAARYVANGANEELNVRMKEKHDRAKTSLASLQKYIKQTRAANPNDPKLSALYSRAHNLQKIINESLKWKANYDLYNDLVRGRDRDINGNMTQRAAGQKFIGGITRQEAKEFVTTVNQRFGPAMPKVDAIANKTMDIHRFWSERALNTGLFFPKEAAQWAHVRFKGGSGDYYVPITGNDNLKDQEDAYAIGGVFYKDFAEEGRETIGNGAYMSIVHYASSMARRVAYHEFNTELYNTASVAGNPYGFVAVGASEQTPGNNRTFLYKTQGSNGNPIIHKIALNNNNASDALVGTNRREVENSVMKGFSGVTSFFGFMVTQATMMFGPINAAKDFGEKSYTMVARYGDIDKRTFLTQSGVQIVNLENAKAAWDFAFGNPNNTQAAKELAELAALGGLNTRTGSINRDADKIISAIQKQSPGFKQAGELKDAIGKYNEAWEIHSALATYRALKQSMKGPVDEVAFRMLDSMNFGQSGASSPTMRALYLFFNPTVQGARNTYKTLIEGIHKKGPEGHRKRVTALLTLSAAMALYAAAKAFGGDDEDYGNKTDNLATATVSRNIPIWIGDKYLRIPVPFGAPAVLWNMAVSAMRFGSGTMDAPEAIMHMLQGAAEHTVPFPISQVDFAKDPTFWLMKTLVPQFLGPVLNIASGKNDFGDALVLTDMPHMRTMPEYMKGKRNTDQTWKDMARSLNQAGLGDFRPENAKEFLRLGFIGPTEAMMQWAIGVQTKEGDHSHMARMIGVNRLYTNDERGLLRAFYTAQQKAEELTQQVWGSAGEKPKNLRGDARKAAIANWIASSSLSMEDQQTAQLYQDFEDRLKKANSGKSGEDPKEVMRDYLKQYRRIIGEN